jgi:4-alpha-glucanotransferase
MSLRSVNEVRFHHAVDFAEALARAAKSCGIEAEYWDISGKRHAVSDEVRRDILQALEWDVSNFEALERERARRFEENLTVPLAQTCVVSVTQKSVPLTLPAGEPASICFEIALESGDRLAGSVEACELPVTREIVMHDRKWLTHDLLLAPEVPLGYHSLTVSVNGRISGESALIVCPDRTYISQCLREGARTAGFNVALYGLRSDRNWGCGDFTDLRALCDWAREIGFSFVGVNPLHALHNRAPYNTSPYLPLSMFYKNWLYVDLEGVPEFATSDCAQRLFRSPRVQRAIAELRAAEFVEYERIDRLKRRFLKVLFRELQRKRAANPERARVFADYCQREGELLERFALYCALDDLLHKQNRNRWTWRDWPVEYQDPESDACRRFAQEHARKVDFYKYIQFVIEEQLAAAQEHALATGMRIGLYHDLAVATDNCGSDLWAHRNFYVKGCRVGAPPDDFSPNGQDWCFPPPDPRAHRASGYRLYRESIRKIAQHGGALRMDHVMRLVRLFWIPDGATPAQGAYVRDYAIDLLRILALESVRTKTIIVGEDLGTVTDEIRDLLCRFCVLSYRLFYFEKNLRDGSFNAAADYSRQALVASSTHDLPTIAGFWTARDVEARKAAGLIDDAAYHQQTSDRTREKQRMLDRLHAERLLPDWYARDAHRVPEVDGTLHNAIIGFLAQVPSMLLLLNHEDLTMEQSQQNLPGSTAEYPNWRRKMRWTIEQLRSPEVQGYTNMFRDQLERAGRRG